MMTDLTWITKRIAKSLLGVKSDAALGRKLGRSRSAVHQWADDEPLLPEHALRIRYELAPDRCIQYLSQHEA